MEDLNETGMNLVKLKVSEIKEWEHNARIHTKRNLEALKSSLKEFKQTKPIIVQRSSMRIIAGNGTYQAAVALGWDSIVCNLVDMDDEKAEAYAIADNRTGLLSQWDEKVLTDSLKKIQEQGNLNLSGFDDLELDKMLSFQNGDMFQKITPPQNDQKKTEKDAQGIQKKEDQVESTAQKPKEQPLPIPEDPEPEYDEQITFSVCGFVFSLADMKKIKELQSLMELVKDAPKNEREEINSQLFDDLIDLITEKFMR